MVRVWGDNGPTKVYKICEICPNVNKIIHLKQKNMILS